ncbi:VOC family protein, partial [Mesorhizobium sp. M2A.F.Ca.ET.040.01.1.1]
MIAGIDHFVLTVRSVEATCDFYQRVLGMRRLDEANRPTALLFGSQKINLHEVGRTFEPKAKMPTPGSGDFCLVAAVPLVEV